MYDKIHYKKKKKKPNFPGTVNPSNVWSKWEYVLTHLIISERHASPSKSGLEAKYVSVPSRSKTILASPAGYLPSSPGAPFSTGFWVLEGSTDPGYGRPGLLLRLLETKAQTWLSVCQSTAPPSTQSGSKETNETESKRKSRQSSQHQCQQYSSHTVPEFDGIYPSNYFPWFPQCKALVHCTSLILQPCHCFSMIHFQKCIL